MNYIELLNQFWQTRRRVQFSANETDLYFFLLQESNSRLWENPFECSNGIICATIGISEKTLIDVRNRLQTKGLISFAAGQKKKKSPVYTLLYCKNESINVGIKVSINDSINVSKNPNLLYKLNKKENKKDKTLVFPFSSVLFFEKWDQLLTTPKWKKKLHPTLQLALNKLKDFEEDFVIELIDQAIIGEWQGLVFPDTKSKYENWLRQKGGNIVKGKQFTKGTNDSKGADRKAEIMRRANQAVANSDSEN